MTEYRISLMMWSDDNPSVMEVFMSSSNQSTSGQRRQHSKWCHTTHILNNCWLRPLLLSLPTRPRRWLCLRSILKQKQDIYEIQDDGSYKGMVFDLENGSTLYIDLAKSNSRSKHQRIDDERFSSDKRAN